MSQSRAGLRLRNSSRPRIYYGWYVALACNVVAFITWGVAVFNQGVFLAYFADEEGWPRSAISLAPSPFYVWAGLAGSFVGRMVDRRGPRPVLLVGAGLLAASACAIGAVRSLWQLYPAFLVLASGYAFMHMVTPGAIVSRWFVRDRIRPMADATVGAG